MNLFLITSQDSESSSSSSSSLYPLEIRNSYFEKNQASNKGGSIFSKDFISISQSTFKENSAISGGAFYRSFPARISFFSHSPLKLSL